MSDGEATQYGMTSVPDPGPGPPPGALPPDRRPWILGGIIVLILIVALVLLLTGSDDDKLATDSSTSTTNSTSSTTSTTRTTSTSSTTSTVVETTSTAVPEPAPTTAPPEAPAITAAPDPTTAPTTTAPPPVVVNPVLCTAAGDNQARPEFAAQAVHEAFLRGDEECAAQLMTDEARAALFALTPQDRQFERCTDQRTPNPHTDCSFAGAGTTTLHLLMTFSATDGWQVFQVAESQP